MICAPQGTLCRKGQRRTAAGHAVGAQNGGQMGVAPWPRGYRCPACRRVTETNTQKVLVSGARFEYFPELEAAAFSPSIT
ncbi:uncharacterized protein N7515_002197 [Penicillium bovifimosum]|uniref:Uncharacterized protein n=1 Tax=Penicillium bovifimosum TaxID=126998 RepID=A0A9W9HBR2_9EURO|nr:uncharacterized protein N7515_002197 [Penicillium bovifimosum]KAJ5143410.1 hypothetical protein N7515_002197 [Penicillium bovifimosum]